MARRPQRRNQTLRKIRVRPLNDPTLTFDYKDPEALSKYVTDRGKLMGRSRTGLSAKQQRRLAIAVKRARFLGLLPYTQRVV